MTRKKWKLESKKSFSTTAGAERFCKKVEKVGGKITGKNYLPSVDDKRKYVWYKLPYGVNL